MAAESHAILLACRVLAVSESGYYAQHARPPSPRAIRHALLTERIGRIHLESRGTYGARRVHTELTLGQGLVVGRCAVELLMRRAGIAGSMNTRTYSVRSPAVSTVKKSQAMMPSAWARRNSAQVGPFRLGAGPSRAVRSKVRIVVALTRIPSLRSSPSIRTQPQRGFSRTSRRISARTSGSMGGRPGRPLLR